MRWMKDVQRQFEGREELSLAELQRKFGNDIPAEDLQRALSVIEEEYGVSLGRLRPEDELRIFLEPRGRSVFDRLGAGDRGGQLNAALVHARRDKGVDPVPSEIPRTLRGFVRAFTAQDNP